MACLPWFKLPTSLPADPRVRALERAVGPAALAYLVRLRAWLASYAPTGRYSGPDPAYAVERGCEWTGEDGHLVQAFVRAGFLAQEGESLVDVEWAEEQAAHATKAAAEAARKREARRKKKEAEEPAHHAGASAGRPADVHRPSAPVPHEKEREREREKSLVREAEETTPRERQNEVPSQPPRKKLGDGPVRAVPTAVAQDANGGESLPDGIQREFREAREADYTWKPGRDDPASRELLSLAGAAGAAEVVRRWGNGVRARYKQRCDTLSDLVRRWEANATPEDGGAPGITQPADARRRAALDVGRGEEPPRVSCATGCGAVSSQFVWGHALSARCLARLEAAVPHWTAESVTAWVQAEQARLVQQPGGSQ